MNQYDSYLKKHLEKLNKNLYVSKDDPNYYDKLYRYSNQSTPELHYHLGMKYEEEGYFAKALNHYQKSAQYFHSPYYSKSKKAINNIEEELNNLNPISTSPIKHKRTPAFAKAAAVLVLLLFVCVLAFLLGFEPVSRAISSFQDLNNETEVIYENDIIPFVYYFEPAIDMDEVEDQLHKEVMKLSRNNPSQTVFLYGVMTSEKNLHNEVNSLEQQKQIDEAFVLAEYNSSIDDAVRIRYLPNRKYLDNSFALNYIASNIVRTALLTYIDEKGKPPEQISEILKDYPDNYISFIPNEISTLTNEVYSEWNGGGGWVFNPQAEFVHDMFYPNINNEEHYPFKEIRVEINKSNHSLNLINEPYTIQQKSIAYGTAHLTPEGKFHVQKRVLKPKGETKGVFGAAGLELNEELAIHGNNYEIPITEQESWGCIRLNNEDILEIFPIIPLGTPVDIENIKETTESLRFVTDIEKLIPVNSSVNNQSSNEIFNWSN